MIKLIVDSTFGLTDEYIKKHDISVVSLNLLLDDITTKEGGIDTWNEFYTRLENSKSFPKTSLPSPQDFINAIDNIYKKELNADIIILTIAESLSGTINSAKVAIQNYEGKNIVAIDSLQATVGSKVVLEKLVEEIENGISFDEAIKLTSEISKKVDLFFVPETMEYLKRGGRIGKLSATIASVLSIKPIFYFKEGVISVTKKALGLSRAINDMIALLPKTFEKIYVCYIHNKQNLQLLTSKVQSSLGLKDVEAMPVCPVFGCHVGIGAIGIAVLAK